MAKMDYNAINFRNKDVDKFSTRFNKVDPEKDAARKATQTAGMTEAQKNLYNQKGAFGQKMYAKKVAKTNVTAETANNTDRSSTTTKPAKTVLTPEQKETKKTNRSERLNKTMSTVGTLVGSTLGAVGLYNQSKNKKED